MISNSPTGTATATATAAGSAGTTPAAAERARLPFARTALILIAAVIVATALNALVAFLAVQAGASASYPPLTLPVFATFTVLGVAIGWIGWRIVQRRAARPGRVLAILVPAVVAASLVPNVVLLFTEFIPGTNPAAVWALMAMHVIVAGVGVIGYVLASRTTEA